MVEQSSSKELLLSRKISFSTDAALIITIVAVIVPESKLSWVDKRKNGTIMDSKAANKQQNKLPSNNKHKTPNKVQDRSW